MSFQSTMAAGEKMRARAEAKGTSFLSKDQKLEVYGLMQQGMHGDVNCERPGIFSPIERVKWDSWEKNKGMPKEVAQKRYIELMKGYMKQHGQDDLLAEITP